MLHTCLYLQIHQHIGPSYIFFAESQYCQFRKVSPHMNTTLWRSQTQNRRLTVYSICIFIASGRRYCDPSFCWLMCLFVGRLVGWFVRSFDNILPTAAMAGWGAFSSCTYLLYKPSYSKFTVKIFVTAVTGVGLRQILLPQLNCSTPKTPY